MRNIQEFLDLLMEKAGFPEDSKDTFRHIHALLLDNASASAEFDRICTCMDQGEEREVFLRSADALAEQIGVHPYSMELYLLMAQALPLREKYEKGGIPEEVFWDTMKDLRAKLCECRDVYGINGSFVVSWICGFYDMTRFGLGRLQFEITEYHDTAKPYPCMDSLLQPGDPVINIHIPSIGPLTTESVLDALKKAYNFPLFADVHVGDTTVKPFVCHSWLLYPGHREFLPAHSNILKFMDCFDIIESDETDEFGNKWRVFGKDKDTEPDKLPQDTSLRKAYAQRLIAGQKSGHGYGVLLFDGEKIINKGEGANA